METGLTSGWHMSRGGATYGPYEWNDLVAWAQGGRLAPGDLVWQAQLPGWMPAGKVPGLFPAWSDALVPAYGQSQRISSHRGRWALIAGLSTLVVAGAVVGVLFAAGVFSKQSVVVETPMQGPTVIDVPYDSSELVVSPEDGGQLEFQGAQISVPPGAVASDATLEVKVLPDDFNVSPTASPEDEFFAVGPVVDFGPAGTAFDQPVTVTVPYDEGLLPAGIPEENVALVYWDGSAWVTVQGTVDTSRNTVTAQLREFDGVVLTTVAALVLVPVAVGMWVYKLTRSDPIIDGKADTYIIPDNSTVKQMAQTSTCGGVSLANQQALAQHMESLQTPTPQKLAFTKPDGTQIQMNEGEHYDAGAGTNWQMPNAFFDKNMKGDCTDVTNAMVSVFRSLGYEARGVFGYETDPTTKAQDPHAWGEVLIGGKVYLIDEQGQVSPRERAMELQHLERPKPEDARYKMWDDVNHVQKQDPDWYKRYLTSTTTSTTAGIDAMAINGTWVGQASNGTAVDDVNLVISVSEGGTGSATATWKDPRYSPMQAMVVINGDVVEIGFQDMTQLSGNFTGGNTLTLSGPSTTWKLTRVQ